MKIPLHRTVASLAGALDFVGEDELHHGKRAALIAAEVAHELGWPAPRRADMLFAGLIHDCGVSRLREHRQLNDTLEWSGAEEHCVRGERFLGACPPLERFAPLVRWHHTRWEDLDRTPLDDDARLATNLLFLADRADCLLAPYFSGPTLKDEILWEYPQVVERIAGLAGTLFAPVLVDAFRRAGVRESFWLAMDPSYIDGEIDAAFEPHAVVELDTRDALAIARLFARTTDATSTYTLEHSTRVGQITRRLAAATGRGDSELDMLEIAALLHDIGKLRIPEVIIDKPGPLTREERALVMRHSYDTAHILRRVFPGQPIADWAGMHHENLLGTGYPSHRSADRIPTEARLIALADVFQALAQARPYRPRLGSAEVMARIDHLAAEGRLDADLTELLRAHLEECYALAVG